MTPQGQEAPSRTRGSRSGAKGKTQTAAVAIPAPCLGRRRKREEEEEEAGKVEKRGQGGGWPGSGGVSAGPAAQEAATCARKGFCAWIVSCCRRPQVPKLRSPRISND